MTGRSVQTTESCRVIYCCRYEVLHEHDLLQKVLSGIETCTGKDKSQSAGVLLESFFKPYERQTPLILKDDRGRQVLIKRRVTMGMFEITPFQG
jgi:hypothetical protein